MIGPSRIWLVVIGSLLIGTSVSLSSGEQIMAQKVQLSQEINAYICNYSTQSGSSENNDSTCQNQPVPILTQVTGTGGRPILQGRYDAARARYLSVWFSDHWYKYGRDKPLSAQGDRWTLDLSTQSVPIKTGTYDVVVEVETNDGLLLRNVGAGSFTIPPDQSGASIFLTNPAPTPVSYTNTRPHFIQETVTTIPELGSKAVGGIGMLPSVSQAPHDTDDVIAYEDGWTVRQNFTRDVIVYLIATGIAFWLIRRFFRR